ncbi:MAG: two-component sensor histidine kinase [Comamonadaceae bacterium]|nr:MAG: two-component sensor histidine kinase [Comamonadaceae bacterium]
MNQWLRSKVGWWAAWLALSVAGAVLLARAELSQLQQDFETDARIAHRLMSQQVVQYDAVLATLALLQPGAAEQRLSSVYPSILGVQRREGDGAWPDGPNAAAFAAAEAASRRLQRAELAVADLPRGRYWLVIGATPTSYALQIDLGGTVPRSDWPMNPKTSPVRVALDHAGQQWTLQPGRPANGGWRFEFHKVLASGSQAFDVVATRDIGWHELPWRWMAAWALAMAALLFGASALQRQRVARRRAEELLRLGQVARLNSLGELSAGLAHELNQPLTAVLANTQAARRLLEDEPPDLATARGAMTKAVEQARRAADVVGRLRRVIERPEAGGDARPLVLQEVVRNALHLLAPEFAQRGVVPQFDAAAQAPVRVQAEAVALEQIVHNLLMNALQSLDKVPASERQLSVSVVRNGTEGVLNVTDTGTGIPPEALPRLFEPFFSTREGGLGLGLSLSETLAAGMGGSLGAANTAVRGARFTLLLPLVAAPGRAA